MPELAGSQRGRPDQNGCGQVERYQLRRFARCLHARLRTAAPAACMGSPPSANRVTASLVNGIPVASCSLTTRPSALAVTRPPNAGVESVAVEDGDGEDVDGEGQGVHADAEAGDVQLAGLACCGQRLVEVPAVVVDGGAEGAVVLCGAEEFFAELADHALPQAEVVALGCRGVVDGLEDADGHGLVHPARVGDLGGIPPVQQERRLAGPAAPQGERGDRGDGGAAGQVDTDRRPGRAAAGCWPVSRPGRLAMPGRVRGRSPRRC